MKNQLNNECMHNSMRFMMIFAQIFSLLPIEGICSKTPHGLTFKWISLRTFYCFAVLCAFAFIMIVNMYHFFWFEWTFYQLVMHTFYLAGFSTIVIHMELAKYWPNLMKEWYKVDTAMELKYGYPKNLNLRLKTTASVLMVLAIVEHLFSLGYHAEYALKIYNNTLTFSTYMIAVYPSIFEHIQPTLFTSVLVQLCTFYGTFFWNYNDLFVILVSSAMALRFRQITQNITSNRYKVDVAYWAEVRQDYERLANLNRILDRTIAYITLHSFVNNLIFILVQLFFSLSVWKNNMKMVYFFYSFGFLIGRTVAVSLYAAWINDESKEPVHILNSLPSYCYNSEVRRFLMQIDTDAPALTGCKMFKITRGLILNIAGAIVTYELVLIQFNSKGNK